MRELTPPPVEESKPSFHVVSGMYWSAEPFVSGSFEELQKAGFLLSSPVKRVPPTAVTSGIAPGTSTAKPVVAIVAFWVAGSQSVAPASPIDELTVCP